MLIVGTVLGFLSGLGIGGGSLLILWLTMVLHTDPLVARSINLLFFIPVTLFALVFHIKNRLIDIKTALICSAFGIAAVVAGFYLAQNIDNEWLRKAFAVFIIISGLKDLFGKKKKDENLTDGQ